MQVIICERKFLQPITMDQFCEAGKPLGPCLDVRGIRWMSSALSPTERTAFVASKPQTPNPCGKRIEKRVYPLNTCGLPRK